MATKGALPYIADAPAGALQLHTHIVVSLNGAGQFLLPPFGACAGDSA